MEIGFVSFGMPPEYNRTIRGSLSDTDIENLLNNSSHVLTRVHVHTAPELSSGLTQLRNADVKCLIVVLSHWTRISLVVRLVREMGFPAALYGRLSGGFNGTTALTAASAGLREFSGTAGYHVRFREGMEDQLLEWIDAVDALATMRDSRLMCWGGPYGANMPYTRSDPDWLEGNLVAEVMTEQEIVLTTKADQIIRDDPERPRAFLEWAMSHGLGVESDASMCTNESITRQSSLYLAARDRLSELAGENIRGVSLKCHFELSTTHWGCTGCMLPAFLPFPEGPDGRQSVIPMACEGDLNGLVSLLLLHSVNPDVPPLFGDFVEYNPDYVLLRNCGSSSVWWAGASNEPAVSLAQTTLRPNMHGASGAAVHYETPDVETVTAFRLFRLGGEFRAFLATGRVIAETESTAYSDPWPHTRVDFGLDSDLLFQAYPCNHSSLTAGDYASRIEWMCRLAGIRCHAIRSDTDLRSLIDELHAN